MFCQPTIIKLTLSEIITFPSIRNWLLFPSTLSAKFLHDPTHSYRLLVASSVKMATTSAVFAPTTVTGAVVNYGTKSRQRIPKVVYIGGMNSYSGLKAQDKVATLGMPVSVEQCFANFVCSFKANGKRRTGRGGALSAKCSNVGEIFKIAAIMNGLVLVGVAVGFVLLRIEAWFEESEQ